MKNTAARFTLVTATFKRMRRECARASILGATLLLLLVTAVFSFAGTTNITVTPSNTFQTWKYWMCGGPNWPGAITTDPSWSSIKTAVIGQLVNQLGCNTLSMTVQSGTAEQSQNYYSQWIAGTLSGAGFNAIKYTPTNDNSDSNGLACDTGTQACPNTFPMDQIDYQLDNFWAGPGGMREEIIARGDNPYLVMTFVHWPAQSNFIDTNPAEMGEFFLAAFRHMSFQYGFVPDVIDVQVEPDGNCAYIQTTFCQHFGVWDSVKIAHSLTAIKARLAAGGFSPILECCSTITAGDAAPGWYTQATAITGKGVVGLLSTHLYSGYLYNQPNNSTLSSIAAQAATDGIPTVMSEYDIAGLSDALAVMTQMNATGFLKYGAISMGKYISTTDYLKVTSPSPYTAAYVTGLESSFHSDEPAWFLPQLMNYVRPGAVREGAAASDSSWVVAFRRNGIDVVVDRITTTGTQTIIVSGVAAGTYDCTYTWSNSVLLEPCGASQTIGEGGILTATLTGIPKATLGVITAAVTFYGKPPVSVEVTPSTASLIASGVNQFFGDVNGSADTAVSWSISPQVGTISASGVYTAPASISSKQYVLITAVSAADATAKGSATTLLIPPVVLSINPSDISLSPGQQQQLGANMGATPASGVQWSVTPQVGTISASGLYTAPASIPGAQKLTVTATIGGSSNETASASINLFSPASKVGLVEYLTFDETSGVTAHDASGNGNNGTLECLSNCLPLPAWTAGMRNGALNFPLPGDFVSVPDSAGLRLTNQFTVAFWVNVWPGAANIAYVQKVSGSQVGEGSGVSNGYLVATGNPGNYVYINLYNANARAGRCVTTAAVLKDQAWQHYAVTYDGAAIRFYVGGVLNSQCNATGSAGTDSTPVTFGGSNQTSQTGIMDEVRIYNRALSAQEILNVYSDPGQPAQ